MERVSPHRVYSHELLRLALELSEDKYGPFELRKQTYQTGLNRQLQNLKSNRNIDVATSMPKESWLESITRVPFPILKGLASYRVFFTTKSLLPQFDNVNSVDALSKFSVGQGIGWSTSNILSRNGIEVVHAPSLETAFNMLHAQRFSLLMRGVYEAIEEHPKYQTPTEELKLVDNFAVFTYLPLYFYVSKENTILAERLEYGLKLANASGKIDELMQLYFSKTFEFLEKNSLKVIYLKNINIDDSFYSSDSPYLLESINQLKTELNSKTR